MKDTNEVMEMKKEFTDGIRRWFKSHWQKNFQYKPVKEIMEKLQFDKMRAIHELSKVIGEDELTLFQEELVQKLEVLRNEMLFSKITYYSMRFVTKKVYKNLELEICYIQSKSGIFDVYEKGMGNYRNMKSQKLVMDEETLKKYLAHKNSEEFKVLVKKSS